MTELAFRGLFLLLLSTIAVGCAGKQEPVVQSIVGATMPSDGRRAFMDVNARTAKIDPMYAVRQADRSDPLVALVADGVSTATQSFEPILGGPLSEEARESMIQRGLAGARGSKLVSMIEARQRVEQMADEARMIDREVPGATDAYYRSSKSSIQSVETVTDAIEVVFVVPEAERAATVKRLGDRVLPMFRGLPPQGAWSISETNPGDPYNSSGMMSRMATAIIAPGSDHQRTLSVMVVDTHSDAAESDGMVQIYLFIQSNRVNWVGR